MARTRASGPLVDSAKADASDENLSSTPRSTRGALPALRDLNEDLHLLPSTESHRNTYKKLQLDPFPNFDHPTPLEAHEVFERLSTSLGRRARTRSTRRATHTKNTGATCGDSPNVIDALIGTVLSQNTSSRNSSTAKRSLDARFGKDNLQSIAEAPLADVVDALRHGGLANKKAATIQNLLRSIKARHGVDSLQHLAESSASNVKSDEEIMEELLSYRGVGPKTAACVMLFCIGRDSFAVDTHVYRLSKMLGWVPGNADRVKTQAHLDRRIPDELKYGMHVMMVRHGKACKGCKRADAKGECVLKAEPIGGSPGQPTRGK